LATPPNGATEGRLAAVAAAILVGGRSSRMGRDKASLVLEAEGVSLLERAARMVAPLASEVWIVGGPVRHVDGVATRWTADPPGAECALRGLVAALEASDRELVWVIAVDLPHLEPELLLALFAHPPAEAVVPRHGGRVHSLCGLYRRAPVLEAARRRLAAGENALRDLLDEIDTAYLEGEDLEAIDPDGRQLINVNTPEQWSALAGTR
jgi:molybdopterin-guanine dinucleotide biosynthesis protein A